MQAHRGLPKNLPQRRNKAKIFSPSISPVKNPNSPDRTDQGSRSNSKTPRKSSPSSESQHRLKSKQKPDLNPPKGQKIKKHRPSVEPKQFDPRQDETTNPRKTQFVQSVGGMLERLIKKTSPTQNNDDPKTLRQKNQLEKQKSIPKSNQLGRPIGPLLFKPRTIQHPGQLSDKELLGRCVYMLQNPSNWQNFCGQQKQNLRTGYGILYFKNKDKYMGGFKQNKADGHGTYYFNDLNKRVMAIWSNNEISFSSGYMMEKLQSK